MLTSKQIDRKIRSAFLPFRCDVMFGVFESRLRFIVFDHNRNRILEIAKLPAREARDESSLNGLLSRLRHRVQESGYDLKPVT